MKLSFDTNGNEKQKQACRYWIDLVTTDIVYGGSKGSGKSYLGCNLIFSDAFTYPETHYFIAREALNDLRKFTIPSIHEVFNAWGITSNYYKYNGQDNLFTLHNGSVVYLLEAKYYPSDPLFERFGSMQMTRGWIEEAGQVSEDAKNNLSASIGRWKNDEYKLPGKLLQTCNPAKNYLYKIYKAFRDGQLDSWIKFIQALPTDNKMLDSGYLDHLSRTLSPTQKQRLLFGNWEYDDDPAALCEYEKLVDLFTNDFEPLKGQKYITADIARFGSDKIVIGLWDGWRVAIHTFSKQSLTDSYAFIDRLRKENNIPLSNVLADEDGVGGGIVDMLKCKGFVNGSKALDGENYENIQAQCAFKLAERINQSGIFIAGTEPKVQQDITEELEQLKQKNIDSDGKKGIVGKDVVKSLIGRSPDYRDMLLMRMWFELKPNKSSGKFDYDFGSV
jgi:phage terminase large subunit